MNGFFVALSNVLIVLFYILPGFIIRKMKKADPDHLPTLSAILVYIGTPFLEISAFMMLDFSWEIVWNMVSFFFVTLILQSLFMGIIYFVFRKRYGDVKYRILTAGSVMGNVGFFGLPVVRALLPGYPEAACYSAMYMVSMNILVFTIGVFCLTGDKKHMSLKSAFFNPTVFGLLLAIPFFVFGLRDKLPGVLVSAIQTVGGLTTPLCMFILGIRLASAPLKSIFSKPIVYVNALMKLLVFPLFCYGLVYFLPFSYSFKAGILILSGVPCASVLLGLAEMHRGETELAANCLLVSTALSFITVPILSFLFL